jgi:hypothetical protein
MSISYFGKDTFIVMRRIGQRQAQTEIFDPARRRLVDMVHCKNYNHTRGCPQGSSKAIKGRHGSFAARKNDNIEAPCLFLL